MKSHSPNQQTGFRAPGFRFRFHVRSIARPVLFLPLEMKEIPEIKRLLNGESPLEVFKTDSLQFARRAFASLRRQYDFPYWAINQYFVRNRWNADEVVPLKLNLCQRYLIDIMLKRYYNRLPGRYVVSKTAFPCGVTTCIQAYILWSQRYRCANNSYTCSSSDINLHPLKQNLCRWLHRDIVPAEKWLFLPFSGDRALFNTFRNPNFTRGINLGYVHYADMGKWKDPKGILTRNTISASVSGVLLDYFTLVIFEGNVPKPERFDVTKYQDFSLPIAARIKRLQHLSTNPHFLNFVAQAADTSFESPLFYIDLDNAYQASRRLQIHPIMEGRLPSRP